MRPAVRSASSVGGRTTVKVTWKDARVAIVLLSGKWVLDVLAELSGRPRRYAELRRSIRGIREKVLTETLLRMESQGLICRDVISSDPLATGWRLTPLGRSLAVPVAGLATWAVTHRVELAPGRSLTSVPRSP